MAEINQNDPGKNNTQDSWAWLDSLSLIEDIKPSLLIPSAEKRPLEDKGDCKVLEEMVSVSMDQTLRLEREAARSNTWGRGSQRTPTESFQKPNRTISEGNDVILEQRIGVTSTGHQFGYKIMEHVVTRDLFNTCTFLYWIPDDNAPQVAELANPTGSEELVLNRNNSCALVNFDTLSPVNFQTESSEIVQMPSSPLQLQVPKHQQLSGVSEPRNRKEQQSYVSTTATVESHKIKDKKPVIDPFKYQVDANAYVEMAMPRLRGGGPVLQEKREKIGFERARRGDRKWKPKNSPAAYLDVQCRYCGREFQQHSMLKRHFKIHEGNEEELHRCSVCEAPYKCKTTLVKHMNQAHSLRLL